MLEMFPEEDIVERGKTLSSIYFLSFWWAIDVLSVGNVTWRSQISDVCKTFKYNFFMY